MEHEERSDRGKDCIDPRATFEQLLTTASSQEGEVYEGADGEYLSDIEDSTTPEDGSIHKMKEPPVGTDSIPDQMQLLSLM